MADRKNQGLAKRIRAAEVAASIDAYDGIEDPTTTTKTRTDRFDVGRRLRRLEAVHNLAATGALKIAKNRTGLENRLRAIEAAE